MSPKTLVTKVCAPAHLTSVLAVSPLMLLSRRTRRGGHGEDVARSEAEKKTVEAAAGA